MSKNRTYDREFSQNEKLKRENSVLKRDLAKLRRMVSRLNLDSDKFRNLKELTEKQAQETQNVVKAIRDWTCFDCGKGIMTLHKMDRRDGKFYFRMCSLPECGKRTVWKKYSDDVEQS